MNRRGFFAVRELADDVRPAEPVADLAPKRALDADYDLVAFAFPDFVGVVVAAREDFAVPETVDLPDVRGA